MSDFEQVVETIKRHTSRDTVTMNTPLEPWGHTRFHKFLAIHMHNATRLAGDNGGLVDDVETAQKWDLAMVAQ